MIDKDLHSLSQQSPEISLERLEADIWTGVNNAALAKRAGRVIACWQLAAMVVVLIGSVGAGAITAVSARSQYDDFGHAGADLAPSTLLMGCQVS